MRRYRYRKRKNDLSDIVAGIAALVSLGIFGAALVHPREFYEFLISACFIALIVLVWFIYKPFWRKARTQKLLGQIKDLSLEGNITNFIDRFSFESKSVDGWTFRNRRIDWHRIGDLEDNLINRGIKLRTGKGADIYEILKFYIQVKEQRLTTESIKQQFLEFSRLSGSDFEKLLYRLFEKMGYNVELTGRSGDQGGDLIANQNGERILIQAKCYRDWSVGNAAVQQVVGAMKYYDCAKTKVITTSAEFTKEAQALARANNTELVSKTRLSEMLLQYLGESWG